MITTGARTTPSARPSPSLATPARWGPTTLPALLAVPLYPSQPPANPQQGPLTRKSLPPQPLCVIGIWAWIWIWIWRGQPSAGRCSAQRWGGDADLPAQQRGDLPHGRHCWSRQAGPCPSSHQPVHGTMQSAARGPEILKQTAGAWSGRRCGTFVSSRVSVVACRSRSQRLGQAHNVLPGWASQRGHMHIHASMCHCVTVSFSCWAVGSGLAPCMCS